MCCDASSNDWTPSSSKRRSLCSCCAPYSRGRCFGPRAGQPSLGVTHAIAPSLMHMPNCRPRRRPAGGGNPSLGHVSGARAGSNGKRRVCVLGLSRCPMKGMGPRRRRSLCFAVAASADPCAPLLAWLRFTSPFAAYMAFDGHRRCPLPGVVVLERLALLGVVVVPSRLRPTPPANVLACPTVLFLFHRHTFSVRNATRMRKTMRQECAPRPCSPSPSLPPTTAPSSRCCSCHPPSHDMSCR